LNYSKKKLISNNDIVESHWSCDLETDGSIPGKYSISSIGFCLAGFKDREGVFITADLKKQPITIYRELQPISNNYQQEALDVSQLDRQQLLLNGYPPKQALSEINKLIDNNSLGQPVFVAYPLSFDWMFYYWYYQNFLDSQSLFGFSQCLDIKSIFYAYSKQPLINSNLKNMPEAITDNIDFPHTHNFLILIILWMMLSSKLNCFRP
jgi:hypothetical protein